jgi:hypothetical protein
MATGRRTRVASGNEARKTLGYDTKLRHDLFIHMKSSNKQYSAHDRNGSPSAIPFQVFWSWLNIRSWTAVWGAYTHRERYGDMFNCRLTTELFIASYNMIFVFGSSTILPVNSVVCLAATTPCRLRPYNLLGSLDIHCIYNIPQTAISSSLLLYNVQRRTDTSVCLQIMLNNIGTWMQ